MTSTEHRRIRTERGTCVIVGPPGSGTRQTVFGGRIRTGRLIDPDKK